MANDSAVPMQSIFLDFATASVTTAWTTLDTALNQHSSVMEVYNSSSAFLELGVGATAAEVVLPFLVFPSGGNGRIGMLMDQGARLAVRRSQAGTVSVGVIALNLFR